jgi:hypothetical protein
MTDRELTGRKLTNRQQLDRLVTYCFDKFDLSDGMADLADLAEHERAKYAIRRQRWGKRATRYAQIRDWL